MDSELQARIISRSESITRSYNYSSSQNAVLKQILQSTPWSKVQSPSRVQFHSPLMFMSQNHSEFYLQRLATLTRYNTTTCSNLRALARNNSRFNRASTIRGTNYTSVKIWLAVIVNWKRIGVGCICTSWFKGRSGVLIENLIKEFWLLFNTFLISDTGVYLLYGDN